MNINETMKYACCELPQDIARYKLAGHYNKAISLIDARLAEPGLTKTLEGTLKLQKLICQLLPAEFPYTKDSALALIREEIPDFTLEELEALLDQRRIRWIFIDGQVRIFNRFYSSLCKAIPSFARRANAALGGVESAQAGTGGDDLLDTAHRRMREEGSLTTRIRIRATVRLKDEAFVPGTFVRAHLPVPKTCPQQTDIRIEKIIPATGKIAPEDAPQRTVCWEQTLSENQQFSVEYSYLHTARYTDAYNGQGIPGSYDFDLEEQLPHIVFTPYIRELCRELTQGLTDPLAKARAFYDFITLNMKYTFMPSYIVLESIADNCAKNYTGDCGVFALLFITLCRCAGIPAQWQSGLTSEPDFIGGHDWARFYVEPYGWLFADPSYGTSAVRRGKEDRRRFYFGNLDPYRMVSNSAFYAPFTVAKEHLRADPYDNQLGEIETADRGFFFDDYLRSKEILECSTL